MADNLTVRPEPILRSNDRTTTPASTVSGRRRWLRRNDDGSLPLALMLILIASALLLVIAASVIAELTKATGSRTTTLSSQAADSAIQTAVFALNNGYAPPSSAAPTNGTGPDGSKWSYYGTQPAGYLPGTAWSITATGTAPGGKTSVRTALVQATSVSSARPFPQPLFATTQVNLLRSTVAAFDPTGANVETDGYVGTDGNIFFGSSATADGYVLYNYGNRPIDSRCTKANPVSGSATCSIAFDNQSQYQDISNTTELTSALNQCATTTGHGPTAWSASVNGTTIQPGVQCYSSMTFDANTTVAATPTNPALVYVTGAITVNPGISVNTGGLSTPEGQLRILSTGSTVTVNTVAGTNNTVGWLLNAPSATCTFNSNNAKLTINGPVACNTVSQPSKAFPTLFNYDDTMPNSLLTYSSGALSWGVTATSN